MLNRIGVRRILNGQMADVRSPIDRSELVKHLDGVRRLARTLVRDDAEADDVMQEAAVAALEAPGPPRKGLAAWLAGVTRNVVRTRHRTERRRRLREAGAAAPEVTPSAAESVVRAAEQSRLLEHVVNMEEPYRTAVILRFVDGLPPRVIATRLGVPVETVRTHVKRGLARLRAELDRRHGGRDLWRASLLLVAGGVPVRPAAPGSLAAGKKAAAVLVAVAALTLVAWWIWRLAEDVPDAEQPAIELAGGSPMRSEREAGDPPERQPLVVEDVGRERPPLEAGRGEPPTEVREPDTPPEPDAAPGEPTPRAGVPAAPEPAVRPAEVQPPPGGAGIAGRLLADQTGGRVAVPAGRVWIGTAARWVDGIVATLGERVREGFAYEAPRHLRDVRDFEIDLHEVTQAQYQRFLHLDSEGRWRVERELGGTLEQIARALVVRDVPANLDLEQLARQLYMSNFDVLHARHPQAVVRRAGTIDFERTFQRLREVEIRTGTALVFYDRAPPASWPSMRHAVGEAAHPVRGISYAEAEAFATWAGKHIPTEFEWEYASRGAGGAPYPWGARPTRFETRVNGGMGLRRGEGPRTAVVNAFPDGRSPFGLFHTLGNVSEWTSSFLAPYPDSTAGLVGGGRELVVRGGSAADTEALYVRPAYRGLPAQGLDADGAPRPLLLPRADTRLRWTGFRCAVYPEPGRSRVRALARVLQSEGVLPAEAVQADGYAAAEAKQLVTPGTTIENGIYVNRRAWGFVVAPLRRIALRDGSSRLRFSIDGAHDIEDTDTLLTAAARGSPTLLGILATDTTIEGLHVVRGFSAVAPVRTLLRAAAPAGTYIVALQQGRVALLTTDLRYAFYVTPRPITRATASVLDRRVPRRGGPEGRADQAFDASSASVSIELVVPLGSGERAGRVVRLRFAYQGDTVVTKNAGPWRTHPAR